MAEGTVARADAPPGVSRRTLVVGAAWAAPVVLGLAALPAVAASTYSKPVLTLTSLKATSYTWLGFITAINVSFEYAYNPSLWGASGFPTSLATAWTLTLVDSDGKTIDTSTGTNAFTATSLTCSHSEYMVALMSSGDPYSVTLTVNGTAVTQNGNTYTPLSFTSTINKTA